MTISPAKKRFEGRMPAALLALVPMMCAFAGVYIDERLSLGYSAWISACRAAGWSLASLVTFSWELLPAGIIGALTGGLIVQLAGVLLRHRDCGADTALAAHAGCVSAMTIGLLLCTLSLPLPLTMAVEAVVAAASAVWLFSNIRRRRVLTSVRLPTRGPTCAY
jgi:hypothetical protein